MVIGDSDQYTAIVAGVEEVVGVKDVSTIMAQYHIVEAVYCQRGAIGLNREVEPAARLSGADWS